MVSGSNISEQKEQVAKVAAKIFGAPFTRDQIINESLSRCFEPSGILPKPDELRQAIESIIDPDDDDEKLKKCSLAIWLEKRIGFLEKSGIVFRNKKQQVFH